MSFEIMKLFVSLTLTNLPKHHKRIQIVIANKDDDILKKRRLPKYIQQTYKQYLEEWVYKKTHISS